MKKFLVIGNPIEHSLSPKLQNYWIKSNNLNAIYGKLEVHESDLAELCENMKDGRLNGINVTIPFKKTIIPHLNVLSGHALRTQSVNTISCRDGNLIGDNTDIDGFELSIKKLNYDVSDKLGVARFKVEVSSGNETAFEELEIQVRPSNPEIDVVESSIVMENGEWNSEKHAVTFVRGAEA